MPNPNSESWNVLSWFLVGGMVTFTLVLLVAHFSWGRLKSVEWNRLREGNYRVLWIKRWKHLYKNSYLVLCEVPERGRRNYSSDPFRRPRLLCLLECPSEMEEVEAGDRFYVKREKKQKKKIPAHNALIRP